MRVIAGSARSLVLKAPEGLHTRPTTDKTKETLFNVLQMHIPGCVFVDLYSGSGAIGIEGLSRGAQKAYFVDNNNSAISIIKENLNHTRLMDKAVILKSDALFSLSSLIHESIDILFLDPPYEEHDEVPILTFLKDCPLITEDTIIVAETNLDADFDFLEQTSLEIWKKKVYKTSQHVFIKRREKI